MLALLRSRPKMRALGLGFLFAQCGHQIGWVALIWWVVNSARSPQLLGVFFAAYQLPSLLSAPLVGTLFDRVNPKRIAVYALAVALCAATLLALLAMREALTVTLLLGLVCIIALTSPATLTYRRLLLGQLISGDDLQAGYALFSFASEASLLLGPAVGGFIVARWSVAAALFGSAAGMACYLLAVAAAPYVHAAASATQRFDVLKGIREIVQRPLVLGVTLLSFFFFLAYGPLEVALPVAARTIFHTNATGYGALWSAYAVGSVLGLLLLRAPYQRFPTTSILCAIAVVWGVLTATLSFAYSLAAAMAVLCIAGFFWSPYNALESAFIQVQVPPEAQGAVFSMQSSFLYTLTVPLGAVLGGWALTHTSIHAVMMASGGACMLAGVAAYVAFSKICR